MERLIHDRSGTSPITQVLIYLGEPLDPCKTLADYGTSGGSTIIVVSRPCIFIKILGREPIILPVACFHANSSISYMRRLIQARGGAPQNQQILIFCERELDPAKYLADYGISGGSIVQLVWRHQWRRAERYTSSVAGNRSPSENDSVVQKSKWRSKLSAMPLFRGTRV
ncbi:hypothetical protein N431DRAFT_330547 [Stipitochalara longipes BDJ]|nr:hypothetical protein N431DRAFT_330547 [Stipitochalara longipes BDJ]